MASTKTPNAVLLLELFHAVGHVAWLRQGVFRNAFRRRAMAIDSDAAKMDKSLAALFRCRAQHVLKTRRHHPAFASSQMYDRIAVFNRALDAIFIA